MPPTRVRPRLRRVDRSDDRGFTTLEALVAFTLLATVAAASVTATVSATKSSKSSTDRVTAANLAQRDLQSARALRFPSYPTASGPTAVPVNGTTYTVTRSVTTKLSDGTAIGACPAKPNFTTRPYMIVTTSVTWQPATTANTVTMATELAC